MVEHTRPHPRLRHRVPPGSHHELEIGTLYIPAKHDRKLPLMVFFHGGTWVPEVAAAQARMAVIAIQLGAGSGVYSQAFEDPQRLPRLIHKAESMAHRRFGALTLAGWSAGCGAIRQLLRTPAIYSRTSAVLCIDGMHTDYVNGSPGPSESELGAENLAIWVKFAKDAIGRRKRMLITHSEIFPGTFASTTETADYLLTQVGLSRHATLRKGPMGTQQISYTRAGRFQLIGYAGNSAPDHVDELHSLPQYLRMLR